MGDVEALARQSGYAPNRIRGDGPKNDVLFDPNKINVVSGDTMPILRDRYARRAITWAQFKLGNVTGYFFTTHLPHNHGEASSKTSHAKIARAFLQKRRDLGIDNAPTIMVGDMNSFASNYQQVEGGGFESNLVANGFVWAYKARGNPGYRGLDHILYSRAHWTHTGCRDTG